MPSTPNVVSSFDHSAVTGNKNVRNWVTVIHGLKSSDGVFDVWTWAASVVLMVSFLLIRVTMSANADNSRE